MKRFLQIEYFLRVESRGTSQYYAVAKIFEETARYMNFPVLSTKLTNQSTLIEVSLIQHKWLSLDLSQEFDADRPPRGLENETDFVLALVLK